MEEDFFLKNMRGVKPFNKNKKNTIDKKKENKIINTNNYKNKTTTTKTIPKTPSNKKTMPKSNLNLSFGEINKDLKRGKIKVDRRIDLHGYNLLDAQEKFRYEVISSYGKNKRCILVITGKGAHTNKQTGESPPKLFYGKIKNSIISWIKEEELKKYILTYQDAGIEHGGDGAIFVYLRKKRF